jgi:uncharacterized coiled-coil protein SlyX
MMLVFATDIVIATLRAEADLIRRIADLERDVAAFRLLAQKAVHALHDQWIEQERLQARHERLVDEYRALRKSVMSRSAAA